MVMGEPEMCPPESVSESEPELELYVPTWPEIWEGYTEGAREQGRRNAVVAHLALWDAIKQQAPSQSCQSAEPAPQNPPHHPGQSDAA